MALESITSISGYILHSDTSFVQVLWHSVKAIDN